MIQKGDRGSEVKDCQQLLQKWGFSIADDGIFGEDTFDAVCLFQQKNKLQEDGIVGVETEKYLNYISSNVRYGDRGDIVAALQQLLTGEDYSVAIDSIFGNDTQSAVENIQQAYQLTVDGIVGKNTWQAFFLKIDLENSEVHDTIQVTPDDSSTDTNLIVDISHHNGTVDLAKAYNAGIRALFHKATQGSGYTDTKYFENLEKAKAANLLFGAYHFGDGSDVTTQAKHFLSVVKTKENIVPVLDYEGNPSGSSMTFEQATEFVKIIYAETGIYPGLYSGSTLKDSLKSNDVGILKNCWLWIAQYSSQPTIPSEWSKWDIWQYTDGQNGPAPHSVDGIGNCDRDQFYSNADELKKFWKKNSF